MAVKVAVNGTGRIGLCVIKIVMERDDMELVAVNTTAKPDMLEYLLKYDTVHRGIDAKVIDEDTIEIAGKAVRMFSERDIEKLDFSSVGAEVVAECTGVFLTTESAGKHLKGSVKKVVLSAPAKDDTPTYVININSDDYAGEAVVSNASCTTNALAPVCKVLDDAFGIENGLMTTVHSYTNDQNLLDVKHKKDFRRARAAAMNMIPTSTGAAKAIGLVTEKRCQCREYRRSVREGCGGELQGADRDRSRQEGLQRLHRLILQLHLRAGSYPRSRREDRQGDSVVRQRVGLQLQNGRYDEAGGKPLRPSTRRRSRPAASFDIDQIFSDKKRYNKRY